MLGIDSQPTNNGVCVFPLLVNPHDYLSIRLSMVVSQDVDALLFAVDCKPDEPDFPLTNHSTCLKPKTDRLDAYPFAASQVDKKGRSNS
jgi:hypothetical protein